MLEVCGVHTGNHGHGQDNKLCSPPEMVSSHPLLFSPSGMDSPLITIFQRSTEVEFKKTRFSFMSGFFHAAQCQD